MEHVRAYKRRLGDISIHTEEQKARTAEKEVNLHSHRFTSAVKTFLEHPESEQNKSLVKKEHDEFLKETHELKILLQKMENNIMEELVNYYKETEKKAIKEIPLEEWEDIVAQINAVADDIYEMVSWERKQERRLKRNRRPRPEEWHLFRAGSGQRKRMLRRSKHARYSSEGGGEKFFEKICYQKNTMEVMWRENERRQYLLKKSIKAIAKKDHELAKELLSEEKDESAKTKKSLWYLKKKVDEEKDKVKPTRSKMRGWRKIAAVATIGAGVGLGAGSQVKAQSFDLKDRAQNLTDQVSGVFKGVNDKTFIQKNNMVTKVKDFDKKGETVYINYYNKGFEKSPMEVITIYTNLEGNVKYALYNTTTGDGEVDKVYERDANGKYVEKLNVRDTKYINLYMKAKNAFFNDPTALNDRETVAPRNESNAEEAGASVKRTISSTGKTASRFFDGLTK